MVFSLGKLIGKLNEVICAKALSSVLGTEDMINA